MFRADHQEVVLDREPGIRAALVGLFVNQAVVHSVERANRCFEHRGFDQIEMLYLDFRPIDDGEGDGNVGSASRGACSI